MKSKFGVPSRKGKNGEEGRSGTLVAVAVCKNATYVVFGAAGGNKCDKKAAFLEVKWRLISVTST